MFTALPFSILDATKTTSMQEIPFKGTRWFKCDLHIHTSASLCFQDRNVTPDQWVKRALEQGLNCVAVTDHNTGLAIDEIKLAAANTSLTVFPGVEITCDTSKIHLLVLFDVDKTSADVRDFLVRCNIKADSFGKQDAFTSESIFEVSRIANEDGGLVIPAHIDEYNGLGSVSVANLEKYFALNYINAVQVVHNGFYKGELAAKEYLNEYYDNPSPSIDDSTIKEWSTPVKYALKNNLSIVTFSDNPHAPKNSKHGLDGVGKRFTWIKMDEIPSLEGLRQAFLLPQHRVRNDFEWPDNQYQVPSIYFKSITIENCDLNNGVAPLKIELSPQLNTIIGGRGSGKSSILRCIRGVFNRLEDITELNEILTDHQNFYQRGAGDTIQGIINEHTSIQIEIVRNNILHKFTATEIFNSKRQVVKIERLNQAGIWEEVLDVGYSDFFQFEHYSQKQIYEIAQRPNSLRKRIDKAIPEVQQLKEERELIKREYLAKCSTIRTLEQQLAGKSKIQTEINDINNSLSLLESSGISELLVKQQLFQKEKETIIEFEGLLSQKQNLFEELISQFDVIKPDISSIDQKYRDELNPLIESVLEQIQSIKKELEKSKNELDKASKEFGDSIANSAWTKDINENSSLIEERRADLEGKGLTEFENYESLMQQKQQKEKSLSMLSSIEQSLETAKGEKQKLQSDFVQKSKLITDQRRRFINEVIKDDKVKIIVKPFRNKVDFIQKLRRILQRSDHFKDAIEFLSEICFSGNVEQTILQARDVFYNIKKGQPDKSINGFFINLVESMNDTQFDEIDLLLPEDEIEIQYRTSGNGPFKSLSTASAGQKTTAILTFILSYGTLPLILDQPEDDLDNKLVSELIVERLQKAKEQRQIIAVTHNANVPVNGDAEYIISLNSDSSKLEVLHVGTVEQPAIKKEICDVMEGGEKAFEMRYRRYLTLFQE